MGLAGAAGSGSPRQRRFAASPSRPGDASRARILLHHRHMKLLRISRPLFAALALTAGTTRTSAQAIAARAAADTTQPRTARAPRAPARPHVAHAPRAASPRGDTTRSDWATGLVRLPSGVAAAPEDAAMRAAAFRAGGRRVIVSLAERRLWYMDGRDTAFTAPVAVGKGTRLEYGSRAWRFNTPRGVRRVESKRPNPVWTPPDWHYAELARDSGWALATLERGRPARLRNGGQLVVRGEWIVYQHAGGGEEIIPADEEVIFDHTLFVPPMDTRNRRIEGELGAYALSMGSGYLLHGTPHKDSIGQAATHGCIRLGDEAIEYLYRNVAVGTPVYIF
jgi:lipoprotein-anchoring transpeptidase ErfK/SrfK